jgi:hypothetical protein
VIKNMKNMNFKGRPVFTGMVPSASSSREHLIVLGDIYDCHN